MKIKNIFLVLCMLCGLSIAANAQVSFKGKQAGEEKSFTGVSDGETKIGIRSRGKLPKADYNFTANVDQGSASFVTITDASLNFRKIRKANLLATLTEAGQAELAAQGSLLIPFTVDFLAAEEQEDPGFIQIPGTLVFAEEDETSAPAPGGIAEAAAILLGTDGSVECPIGAVAASQGGSLFSLLTEVTPSITGTVTTTTADLDLLGEATEQGRALTAQAQLEGATLAFTAVKKFKKYAKLAFNEGSKAGNFSLENVATTLSTDEQGNVMVSFTADLPATLDFKKRLVKGFVENAESVTALLNGESVAETEVNLEDEASLKAGFKFKKAKGTLFEKNKAQKFDLVFTATGEDEEQ